MNYDEELRILLPQQVKPLQRYYLQNDQYVWVRKASNGNPMIYYKLLKILTVYIFRLPKMALCGVVTTPIGVAQ